MSEQAEAGQPRLRLGLAALSAQTVGGSAAESSGALRELIDACVCAEAAGFDSVWLSEHHGAPDGYLPSPLPVLGALSAVTNRMLLGTGVALAPLYDPLRLAEDVAVLDQLSAGRVMLGLGLGYRDAEFQAFGRARSGRVGALETAIDVARRAWAGEQLTERGGTVVTPLPHRVGGPPILVGAFRRPGIERAARLADGWIAPDLGVVDQLSRRFAWLEVAAPPRHPFHVVLTMGLFTAARDAAETVRPGVERVGAQYQAWMVESGAHPTVDPAHGYRPGASAITGTPAECAVQLRPWVDALATLPEWCVPHLTLRQVYPGVAAAATRESIRLTGAEILPALLSGGHGGVMRRR